MSGEYNEPKADPDQIFDYTFNGNFTLMAQMSGETQRVLGKISTLAATTFVNISAMDAPQSADPQILIADDDMLPAYNEIKTAERNGEIAFNVERYERYYSPRETGKDRPLKTSDVKPNWLFLKIGTVYYAFDKVDKIYDGGKWGQRRSYRYRGNFPDSWRVGLTPEKKCDEWYAVKIRTPGNLAFAQTTINTVDLGLKIFLPGYSGVTSAVVEGKPVYGTLEAVASFATLGAWSKVNAVRYGFAWVALSASATQGAMVVFNQVPDSTTFSLVGPAIGVGLALPMVIPAKWVAGGWQIIQGMLTPAQKLRVNTAVPSGIISEFLDDASLIYKGGLKGDWWEDMPTIMAMVHKSRGKGLREVSEIEFEGIKHSYDAVMSALKLKYRVGFQTSPTQFKAAMAEFAGLMQENIQAGRIWSYLNKVLTGTKAGAPWAKDLSAHSALGMMIADLGITKETLASFQAQLANNPRAHLAWIDLLKNKGWTATYNGVPGDKWGWLYMGTALKGLVRGLQKPSFDLYRLAVLDAQGVPRLFAGAAATGRTVEDIATFAGQFGNTAAEAMNNQFVILRFGAGTVDAVRINGAGATYDNVLRVWNGGVANELVVLTKAAKDVTFNPVKNSSMQNVTYSRQVQHKNGGTVDLNCIPVLDVLQ